MKRKFAVLPSYRDSDVEGAAIGGSASAASTERRWSPKRNAPTALSGKGGDRPKNDKNYPAFAGKKSHKMPFMLA